MNKKVILKAMSIVVFVCFLHCEPVPHNAINDARTALEKAEKAGGRIWAPTQLKIGRACYDSAMKELSMEKRKMPFRRNYKKVIELLDISIEAGYYALQTIQTANEGIRSESRELLVRAKELTDSLDIVLKTAAANKKNVGHLQDVLDSARIAREEAFAELNSGDLLLAQEKAMAASDKTEGVAKRTAELLSSQ